MAPETDQEIDVKDDIPAESDTQEVTEGQEADTATEEAQQDTDTTDTTEEQPEDTPEPLKYGGIEVIVEIPDDLKEAFEGKGIDVQEISDELYRSDDFTLSEESLNKLYDAFGKFSVDSYLRGLKAQNDLLVSGYNAEVKGRQEAAESAWKEVQAIIGEDEGAWDQLSVWANENFSEQEMSDWEEIMSSDNWTMQRLAIKDAWERSGATKSDSSSSDTLHPNQSNGLMTGDSEESLDLIEANGDSRSGDSAGPITNAEYRELWSSSLSPEEMQALDNRRRAGIAKGI